MKKVLVFGTNKYVMQKIKEYGCEVILADRIQFDDSVYADKFILVDFGDKEKNLEIAKEEKIDAVVCATEFSVITCAYICEKLGLPGNSYESAILSKDKYAIRKKMKEKNLKNVPQFFGISDKEELKNIKDEIKFPVILKPADNGGSVYTYEITNFEDLEAKIEEVIEGSYNKIALIESFIEGDEYSIEVFVYEGKTHVMIITQRDMTELPYRVSLGHRCPPEISDELEKKIEDAISEHVSNLGITLGAANFDVIVSNKDGQVYILDTNARLGGNGMSTHVVKLSRGIDHIGNIVKAALGEKDIDLVPKYKKKVYVRVLNLDEGIIKRIPDVNKYLDDEVVAIDFARKLGEKCNKYTSLAERSGIIVSCGDDIEELKIKCEGIRNAINDEVYDK